MEVFCIQSYSLLCLLDITYIYSCLVKLTLNVTCSHTVKNWVIISMEYATLNFLCKKSIKNLYFCINLKYMTVSKHLSWQKKKKVKRVKYLEVETVFIDSSWYNGLLIFQLFLYKDLDMCARMFQN